MTDQEIGIIKSVIRQTLMEFFTSKSISQVQAAEMLGVTPRTISRMLRDGRLSRNSDGKIDREDIARIVHG